MGRTTDAELDARAQEVGYLRYRTEVVAGAARRAGWEVRRAGAGWLLAWTPGGLVHLALHSELIDRTDADVGDRLGPARRWRWCASVPKLGGEAHEAGLALQALARRVAP